MMLIVNGDPVQVDARTLAEALQALGYAHDWLATAVNGRLAPRRERATLMLKELDRIEILSPRQGG